MPRIFQHLLAAVSLAACSFLGAESSAQSGIAGWGQIVFDSRVHDEACVQLSASSSATLALRADGTLAAWGLNDRAACQVPTSPPGLSFVEAQSGFRISVARRSDGVLVTWGEISSTPPVAPPGLSFTKIDAGANFGLALRSDGTIAVWGGLASAPALPSGTTYVDLAAGSSHALAVRSDGVVVGWGFNTSGQCNMPAPPPGLAYVAVAASYAYSLGLLSDGTIVICGAGPGSAPTLPSGLSYTAIAAGGLHALALRSDGAVVGWGSNLQHQCEVPALPPGTLYVSVDAADWHSVALRSDGRAVCWGDNTRCQCNAPALPAGLRYVECAAHNTDCELSGSVVGHFAALRSDGQILTWGSSPTGAVPDLPAGLRYEQLSLGPKHGLALRSDGNAVGWGLNVEGACIVPAPPSGLRYVEVRAGGSQQWEHCSIGGMDTNHEVSLGLLSDGSLRAWGTCSLSQCSVPTGVPFTAVAATGNVLEALGAEGGIARWGGSSWPLPAPPAGTSYVELSLGAGSYYETHCMQFDFSGGALEVARRSDGVVVWNGTGSVPAAPAGLRYVEVAAGYAHALARLSDGSVVAWGDNSLRQCNVPVPRSGTGYVAIAASPFQSMAIFDSLPAQGSVAHTCAAGANSVSSAGATLEARGAASVSVNDLALHVTQLPPHAIGQFVYGSGLQYAPFGNGHLCIGGSVQRVLPLELSSATGAVDFAVDLAQYPFSGSPNAIQPSSAWNFQYWYRDPTSSGPSTFGTSGALHIVFAP